jgi:hypothetical protein
VERCLVSLETSTGTSEEPAMHLILITALALCGTGYPDGSLVVLQHSNKPVSRYTGSSVTHVAMIGTLAGDSWVYEATPAKVRRVPLTRYVEELAELNQRRDKPTQMSIMVPKQPYSFVELTALHRYLDSQLGRRYSVKGYVRGKKGDGIHCAEFTSSALQATGRIHFADRHQLSPSDVVNQVRPFHLAPQLVTLGDRTVPAERWSVRMWDRCSSIQTWCGWAFYELWTFCW